MILQGVMVHKLTDREHVLSQTREFVSLQVSERPSLLAVFLVGSVARADSMWVDVVDVDIVFVDSKPPIIVDPCMFWKESLLIDMHYSRPGDYENKHTLRTDALRAQAIYDAIPLYDTKNYFALLQAHLRGQFDTPENVCARSVDAIRRAYFYYEQIAGYIRNPVPIPVDPISVKSLLESIHWIVAAILMLSYKSNYGRRQMLVFNEMLTNNKNTDLIDLTDNSMGCLGINEDNMEWLTKSWLEMFRAAGVFHEGPWSVDSCVHPFKEKYYLEGFKALSLAGCSRASLLLMEYTFASALNQVITFAPAEDAVKYIDIYEKWMQITYKGNEEQFVDRLTNLTELLNQVESMIGNFAARNSIEIDYIFKR